MTGAFEADGGDAGKGVAGEGSASCKGISLAPEDWATVEESAGDASVDSG